jgi:hypothetical protein
MVASRPEVRQLAVGGRHRLMCPTITAVIAANSPSKIRRARIIGAPLGAVMSCVSDSGTTDATLP